MIKLLLRYKFSSAPPKKLLFVNAKGESILFHKHQPIINQFQRAMDFNEQIDITERMQLLFTKFKAEQNFNQTNYEIMKKANSIFLESNISFNDFYNFLTIKFLKVDHPQYFYLQCQLVDKFLDRYQDISQIQIRQIFHSISGGLFFIEDSIFQQNKLNIYNQEDENYIISVYEKLCDKIKVDLIKDFDLIGICQIMKYIKRYSMSVLDQINQQLLIHSNNDKFKLKYRVFFILFLVRAGTSYFPEIIYKLRDDVLDNPSLEFQEAKLLFQQFEIFGRCNRVTLCQLASAKLYHTITSSGQYEKLKTSEKILLLYYASKSHVISYDLLKPFIEQILSQVHIIANTNLKIILLTLYNINYKNLPNLKELGKVKQKLQLIRNDGKFNESELSYIDDLISCI